MGVLYGAIKAENGQKHDAIITSNARPSNQENGQQHTILGSDHAQGPQNFHPVSGLSGIRRTTGAIYMVEGGTDTTATGQRWNSRFQHLRRVAVHPYL